MHIRYLIYYKKLFANDTIIRNENKNSPILRLAISKNQSFIIDSEDNILNIKGEIVAVIHQYDRHKIIYEKVLKKFSNDFLEENEDKNLFGYKNYNNTISSNLYINQSQINNNYINFSLTNISNNTLSNNKIMIQKGYNNIYLTKNNKKLIRKLILYILIFYILIFLVIILYKIKKKI